MKSAIIALIGALLILPSHSFAKGSKRNTGAPLKTYIHVAKVNLTSENAMAGTWPSSVSCPKFTGTHAGNEIVLNVQATGGDGEYHHTINYRMTRSFKLEGKSEGLFQESRSDNGTIKITFPELDESVPFVQQTVFLITRDSSGRTATASITFNISRTVILNPSEDPAVKAKECFERYTPKESTIGLVSNGSTAPSNIQIKQAISNVYSSTRGWQWGVFVSPLSWIGLGNLVALNVGYFSQISKQQIETVELSTGYQLNPGDYAQLYVQPTRHVSPYDVILVSPCGEQQVLKGAYMFQWWGFAYQIYSVNPFEKNRVQPEAVGAPVINTCPKELTPLEYGRSDMKFRKLGGP